MLPLALNEFTIATCVGLGCDAALVALREGRSGLQPCTFDSVSFATHVGEVTGLDAVHMDDGLREFDCRNHRLATLAIQQDGFASSVEAAKERYGPRRIGVFVGTSTSGLLQTETAYRRRDSRNGSLPPDFNYACTHNTYALGHFVRTTLGLNGPAFVISTACAATAKTFGVAARMIEADLCDAVVVGGADTLCSTTLYGFHSLGILSEEPCRPFDANRQGISIGEAAGFVLLERAPSRHRDDTVFLLGVGESSDAFHMSSPHPEGLGAWLAMQRALDAAGLTPGDIGYISLHGTGTQVGDAAEDRAVFDLFGPDTPCNSTKGSTGHTLGASGVISAIFCTLGIQHGFIPPSPHTRTVDPALRSPYVPEGAKEHLDRAVSNSFGFGGANCSLILGRPL